MHVYILASAYPELGLGCDPPGRQVIMAIMSAAAPRLGFIHVRKALHQILETWGHGQGLELGLSFH